MEELSLISDDEREDGEIVDDDYEEISDYSIPSCGKSEYSKGFLRAISLSSISDSDGDRAKRKKRNAYLLLNGCEFVKHNKRKYCRQHDARRHSQDSQSASRRKKRRRDSSVISCDARKRRRRARARTRKSLSRSSHSSHSDSDSDRDVVIDSESSNDLIDKQTLKQLNKAVRIDNGSGDELHSQHKTLEDRLGLKRKDGADNDVKNGLEDKELEELRLQALKSAMLKKHLERKRRKEMQMAAVQNGDLDKDKENTASNIIVSNVTTEAKVEVEEHKVPDDAADAGDDLDIMRAMLLASMSKKISEERPSSSLQLGSQTSSPIPPEFFPNFKDSRSAGAKKPTSMHILPHVKPLIIQLNNDSDSESDFDPDPEKFSPTPKDDLQPEIQLSVEQLLRTQRQQFEAKLAQNTAMDTSRSLDVSLDKSLLKLLPKSQQQEYKLLKLKLIQASKTNKPIGPAGKANGNINNKKTTNQKDKRDRLQSKGKYRELAPIIKKINLEVVARRKCEEYVKKLMEQLRNTRTQLTAHQRRHATLVSELKVARKTIDLRLAKANNHQQQPEKLLIPQISKPTIVVPPCVRTVTPILLTDHVNGVNSGLSKEISTAKSNIVQIERVAPVFHVQVKLDNAHVVRTVTGASTNIETKETDTLMDRMTLSDKCPESESAYSYVSPLDNRENNNKNNPLEMLCPYELFGVCKDANCTFNHCP